MLTSDSPGKTFKMFNSPVSGMLGFAPVRNLMLESILPNEHLLTLTAYWEDSFPGTQGLISLQSTL